MKFLRNKSLREIGIFVLGVFFLLFVGQYFLIQQKMNVLDETEQKLDYTRKAQLAHQQLSQSVELFLRGDSTLSTTISTGITQLNHQLKTLGEGGRIERTEVFLKPLPRLPRVTFDNLVGYWQDYQEKTKQVLANGIQTETSTNLRALSITISTWFDNLFFDLEGEVVQKKNSFQYWMIGIIVIDILLIVLTFLAFDRYLLGSIRSLTDTISHHQQAEPTGGEVGNLSIEINEILKNLTDATNFVTGIGQGNLSMDYKEALDASYQPGKNKLADSLIEMQQKLRTLNEEERRRQWANEGLAKFVDILRSSNDNIQELGDNIISALVQYTKSNQGGLYLLNDDQEHNHYLELIGLFAFDSKKYEIRHIKLGEGLVGQTYLEQETTYYKQVPEEYIRITSGLGDAPPRSVLIVPLKIDRDVYGIVELASFNEYQDFEIAFVEKLGETIASTLSSVKAAQKNKHLIEQFQVQTEQMRAQEEEMRQNMEELQATQEEIGRKERGYIERIQELEASLRNAVTTDEFLALQSAKNALESHYKQQLENLQQELAKKPAHGDDWEVAENVEKMLRINLEALQITKNQLRP